MNINEAISCARAYLFKNLRIIAYHRICDVDDFNDPELVSATAEEFDD